MAVTQTDLDNINAAIAQGERVVRIAGRTVEYRSVDELITARNHLRTQLAAESGARSKQTKLYHAGRGH